jgi:glycosyltransferase involved in cell wall biosynthesis
VKILSITAGAAGMYCGSCARDNALAAELMARGHDICLVPVYTPTRTDEPNMSRPVVLFGGISVYLQQYVSLFRWTPWFLDRLWDAPGVIQTFAGRMVSNNPRMLGDLTLSMLKGERAVLKKEFEKLVGWIQSEPLPDVINLPNTLLIALAEPLRRTLDRPVCCTLQGEELFLDGLVPPYRDQALALIREQVRHIDGFIAVSDYCARYMAEFLRIPNEKIRVVPLGINLTGYEARSPSKPSEPFRIGYFARVAPEKGLHVLAEAYIRFRKKTASSKAMLVVAGYTSPENKPYLEKAGKMVHEAGLSGEFHYQGVVDRQGKLAFLKSLDVLSVPATYDEPKGMFLLEAMASGVPVVQPRRGAFTEVVEKTGGGVLVAPDDVEALAESFWALSRDRNAGATLGARGAQGVREHYSIEKSTDSLLSAYESLIAVS